MASYYAYRVFLNDTNDRGIASIFREQKEIMFANVVKDLQKRKKVRGSYFGQYYILYKESLTNDIHILQVAKSKNLTLPIIEENSITEKTETHNPYVNILLSLDFQVLLVQHDTTVFNDVETTVERLKKHLNYKMNPDNIFVNINPISDLNKLEDELFRFEKISKIDLEYDAPNLFGASEEFDKLRKEIHDKTGFEKFKLTLSNRFTGLNVMSNALPFFKHLVKGGGRYIITGILDGLKQSINSTKLQTILNLNKDPELEDVFELEEKIKDIAELDNDNKEK